MVTASRSTVRSSLTRRKRGDAAPGGANLFAPLRDGALRAFGFSRALIVVQIYALTRGVYLTDALTALQLAQRPLRLLAVHALLLAEFALLGGFLLLVFTLKLALAKRGFRAERLFLLRIGCGRCRGRRRRQCGYAHN